MYDGGREAIHDEQRTWLGAMVIVVTGLAAPVGLGAAEPEQKAVAPLILNLMNRPVESRERAYTEDIKRDALAPRPSAVDEWEPQPDGSMKQQEDRDQRDGPESVPRRRHRSRVRAGRVQPVAPPPLTAEQIPPIRG